MANYSLVANTQFKSRSFDDLIRPYAMYTQEYRAQEDALAELATKADVWQGLANEQTDPVAYAQYTNYANSLKDQASVIADRGLDPSSRQAMLNLKRRYASEIVPIEQAYANRKIQAEEQRKALLQNPTLMMNRRADSTSLDRYLENPNLGYESYSGALLTQQAGQAAASIAKELRSYGKGKPLDGFTRTWLQQHGYSAGEVAFAINNPNDPRASKVLNSIVNNVMADSGISEWADNKTMNQAYNYARQGLWQAVGQTQVGSYTDEAARLRAQEAMQIRAERRAAARQAPDNPKGFALNPSNIHSNRELTKEEKRYKDAIKNYSNYFYRKNGKWQMSYAGWKEYNRKNRGTAAEKIMTTPEGTTIRVADIHKGERPSEFRSFMDSIGAYRVTKGKWQPGNLGNLWSRYAGDSPASKTAKYDATKTSEYIYDVDQSPEYQRNYKAKISRVIGSDEKFKEVDYNPKTNRWEYTGHTLSFADFDTDEYTLVSRAPSELGNTLFIKKKGEKARRYETLPGINSTAEGARDQLLAEMLGTQRMLQNPKLSPPQRVKLENYYDNLTQQQIMFESQIDVVNSTKKQELQPYYIP